MSNLFVISKLFYAHVVPGVCEFYHAHIRLRFHHFPVRYLSIILGLAYLVIIFFSYRRFEKLKDLCERLRMQYIFLNALMEDVDQISQLGKEIDEKARKHWDSQLRPEATVQLGTDERAWVDKLRKVVHKAKSCCDTYDRLSERRRILKWFYSVLMDFRKIGGLSAEIDVFGRERYNLIYTKKCDQIYGSLENSRSNVRSLQDRPIVAEQQSCTYNPDVRLHSTQSIEEKLNGSIHGKLQNLVRDLKDDLQYNIEFPLKLLLAFLKDLRWLRMESVTEKAWMKQAEDMILDLQRDMDRMRWLSYLGNWLARHQLKKWYHYKGKILRYFIFIKAYQFDFEFVRRDPSKSINSGSPQKKPSSSQATTTDDLRISSLVNHFRNQVDQEHGMDDFKRLADSFRDVHKILITTEEVKGIEHSRRAWTDQLKTIVEDAEKSFNAYRTSKFPEWKEDSQSKTDPEVIRFNIALRTIRDCIKAFRIKPRKENNSVVGLEKDIHEVVSGLITNSENCSTHLIVGMKGIGKTTLARMVFDHRAIKNHFKKFRYWVPIDDIVDGDKNVVQKELGKLIMNPPATENEGKEKEKGTNKKEKEKYYTLEDVNEYLKGKKYLVVLDNISSVGSWDSVKAAFRDSTNGSRIVITTRDKSVASHDDHKGRDPYKLPLRTKDESLKLFQQMVDLPAEPSNEHVPSEIEVKEQKARTLAIKVVGRCGGLPLSILRVGYLLSGKKVNSEPHEFSRVLELMDRNPIPWSETLASNENDLPQHLKECLSFFVRFPKDSETPARRLVALWVTEGFAVAQQNGDKQKPPESIANKYLNELISLNLIQVVERKPNGKPKTCGFPSALREQWSRRPSNSIFDQRLVYNLDDNDARSYHGYGIQNLLRRCRNPTSILFFDTREGDRPGEDIGKFLRMGITSGHLLQLQVLDLEFVFRPKLPNAIRKLTSLTYLGLRRTFLKDNDIPTSIGNLTNLQTLDVRHTYIRKLPSSIWKLQNLRHLYMNQIYRTQILHQPSESSLKNLQTLQGAFVDKDSPLKDGLRRLTNLRKLGLAFQLNLSQQTTLVESLLKLRHLQILKLNSIDEISRPQDLKATFLSEIDNLSNLYLIGKFENPSINGLPKNLTDLTLSDSRLSNDPMQEIGKLEKLKSLCMYSGSYTGRKMSCSKESFPQLQVLNLWKLEELEELNVEEHAMPKLKQLEIRSCNNFKVLKELRHLKALSILKLKDMQGEFTKQFEQPCSDIAHFPFVIIEKQ